LAVDQAPLSPSASGYRGRYVKRFSSLWPSSSCKSHRSRNASSHHLKTNGHDASSRNASNRTGQGRLGHALPTGPLSPLLNRDLRAELRFDVRRAWLDPAYLPWIRLRLGFIHWPTALRIAEHHATPPPCNRAGLSRSGLWGPELLHSLNGIRHRVSSELTRTSCPGYGCARSSGILAYRHAGEESLPRRGYDWHLYRAVH
jgi:hypothetical protein